MLLTLFAGVWHMLPGALQAEHDGTDAYFERALAMDYPVMLYLHGTAGTRAAWKMLLRIAYASTVL